jgi:hypothetical protein
MIPTNPSGTTCVALVQSRFNDKDCVPHIDKLSIKNGPCPRLAASVRRIYSLFNNKNPPLYGVGLFIFYGFFQTFNNKVFREYREEPPDFRAI